MPAARVEEVTAHEYGADGERQGSTMFPVTDHAVKTPRHTSFYLECGRADAVPIIFVHG